MTKETLDTIIQIVLELAARAVEHNQRGHPAHANECSACCDIVEKRLPYGWLEKYEAEQAKLQKSMVGKSRKSPHKVSK